MKSITEIGLLHPITVRIHPAKPTIGNPPQPRYQLCAGLHRFEACKRLEWKEVPATVVKLVGPRAALVEVDENLQQITLTRGQRVAFIKRRKEIWDALYPQTTKGKAQGEGKKRSLALKKGTDRQIGGEIPKDEAPTKPSSFVKSTAAVSGQSTRSVERDVDRTKIADDVLETAIKEGVDSGQALDELKNLPPEQQRERVKAMQAAPAKSKSKPVAVSSTLTPEEKTARDERAFAAAFKPALAIFEEATPQARRNIVCKLASILGPGTVIQFGGAIYKAPRPSLTGNSASEAAPAEATA